jgi:hypothetical protein
MKIAASAPSTNVSTNFERDEIAGNFSLIGNGPITIESAPGLVVRVHSGMIQICHPEECGEQLVTAGKSIVLDRSGPVAIAAISRAQLRIDWPAPKTASVPRAFETDQADSEEWFAYA